MKSLKENTQLWICPPSPFCGQIDCNFCTAMVSNPEFWPRLAIGITALLIYIIIMTLFFLVVMTRKLTRGLFRAGKHFYNCCKPFRCLRRFGKTDDQVENIPLIEIGNTKTKRWSASTIVRILTIVLIYGNVVNACQQIVLIPTDVIYVAPRSRTVLLTKPSLQSLMKCKRICAYRCNMGIINTMSLRSYYRKPYYAAVGKIGILHAIRR